MQREIGYAVKFMGRVDEEQAGEATAIFREWVTPALIDWGFREVLTVSRVLRVTESRVLRRLLEEAPVESGYARRLRDLHETLVLGGPKSYTHSMLHHRNKNNYPEEHRLIQEALESDDNWAEVRLHQFDCYGIYGTAIDMKADTLGRRGMVEGRPHSGDLVAGELEHLLVNPLRGTHHSILYRSPITGEDIRTGHVAQTQVSAFLHRSEAREWANDHLVPALSGQRGYEGALVLRSRNMGFAAGRGTVPRGLSEHRGERPSPTRNPARIANVPCECLTLWRTETDRNEGEGRVVGALPGSVGGKMAGDFMKDIAHTERGEMVSWS